jgi:HK97 family phage portal protein
MPMKWPWKKPEQRTAPDPSWCALIDQGAVSTSGAFVSPTNAEAISTVFACVQSIAESVASLPLLIYRKQSNGDRERAEDYPLYRVLHDAPNERQTALEFREQLTAHVLLWGNGYAEIQSDANGNIIALNPIHPRSVTIVRLPSGRVRYDVADPINGRVRPLLQDEILHLKDRSDDGIVGKSRIRVAREMLGGALAQQEHGNRTFANGTRLSGVLQTPHQMTDEQLARLRDSWSSQYAGNANSGKTAILENGLTYEQLSMSLEDAQWVQSRQFSVEEICRLFRIPPTMVGDLRFGNYSNTSELSRHFIVFGLRRWLSMWEESCERALLSTAAQRRYVIEHAVEGLLRGDAANRADFYDKGIASGWLLPSEARRLENLPTIEGLDDRARQAASAPPTPAAA